jgi:hypothetical protein
MAQLAGIAAIHIHRPDLWQPGARRWNRCVRPSRRRVRSRRRSAPRHQLGRPCCILQSSVRSYCSAVYRCKKLTGCSVIALLDSPVAHRRKASAMRFNPVWQQLIIVHIASFCSFICAVACVQDAGRPTAGISGALPGRARREFSSMPCGPRPIAAGHSATPGSSSRSPRLSVARVAPAEGVTEEGEDKAPADKSTPTPLCFLLQPARAQIQSNPLGGADAFGIIKARRTT